MKRALVIEPSGNLRGSERALLDLLDGLKGVDVSVCCPPSRPLQIELQKRRICVLPHFVYGLHQKSRWQRLRAAFGVFRACLEFRPNVIYLNQSGAYRVALPAAAILNVPIVAHVRIFEDAAYLARQSPYLFPLRGLIAISAAVEREIRRFRELDRIPLHQIYDAYVPAAPESSLSRHANRVVCVGRLVPVKGQDILIRAMGLLADLDRDVEWVIAGDGDGAFIRELKKAASQSGVTSHIRWEGFIEDVLPLLRTCSVLACPSHREPLGRVILEAWDAGAVPVVYAGSGGAAEIVSAAEGGLLYDEQKPQSLAGALKKALELEPEQAARFIANGRAWIANQCDSKLCGEAVSSVLSLALPRR